MAIHKIALRVVLGLWLMLAMAVAMAQRTDSTRIGENVSGQLEEAGYRDEETADPTDLIEELDYLQRNRVKVNEASLEEFSTIPVISRDQAIRLSAYVATYGQMLSPWELMAVDGFDSITIARVTPYIDFSPASEKQGLFKQLFSRPKHRVVLRWQQMLTGQAGYAPASDSLENRYAGTYPGDQSRLLFKYAFETKGGIRAGITAEKDPGEAFFSGSQSGFDFYSAHVFVKNVGPVKQLALGDFHANFGQGLTLWTGFGFSKPSDPLWLNRNGQGLRPSTGTDENKFLRGAGAMVAAGNWRLTAFASSLQIDGTADQSDTTETQFTPSESPTGLHRTVRELAAKDAVTQTVFGGRVTWQKGIVQVGATGYAMRYSSPLPQGTALYQKYYFNGTESVNGGVDFQLTLRRLALFGEAAMNKAGGAGILTGLRWSPDIRADLALLYRNYGLNFNSPLGAAFGENSRNTNEEGFYAAVSYVPLHKLIVSAHADMYRFPWLRYRVDKPSGGEEYGLKGDYELNRSARLSVRYRYERKDINLSAETGEYSHQIGDRFRHSLRGTVRVDVTGSVRLTSLAEWSNVKLDGQSADGYLVGQQVRANIGRWSINGAFMLFSANDWDTRIYVYEPDVLYAFTSPAVYGEGTRMVLLVNYDPFEWISFWLRYSISRFDKQPAVPTSPDDYLSSDRQELKVQMVLRIM